MTFKKNESAGYLSNHMARLFAIALQNDIKPLGLAPAQFMTLLELWSQDGLTQRDLVQRLDVEQATMANTLSRMERDGLIERKKDPADKRAALILLTPHARTLEAPAKEAAQQVNKAALGDLTPEERTMFIKIMNQVIASLQNRKPT
jgi:DNA-binding MarR family transcriptional regulator